MKFIFFGTPRFGAIILGRLIKNGLVPAALVTNPDRPFGRKKDIAPPPAKKICQKLNPLIPVLQPEKIDESFANLLKKYEADFFLIAAYGKILPKYIIDIPLLKTIGVHPSLLPKLRGATPIQSAILEGLKETGVSLFIVDEKMDHGPVLSSKTEPIYDDDNAESLSDRLAIIGADMITEIIPSISLISPVPQEESVATYTNKVMFNDAYIDPNDLRQAEEGVLELTKKIDCKIRAYNPEPGAWTLKNNKKVKLLEAKIINNRLKITSMQIEGKKPIII